MKRFERNILAMAVASACFGACSVAAAATAPAAAANGALQSTTDQAQSQAPTDKAANGKKKEAKQLQAVQVNGFRSSVENSIATQRNSDEIIEAVTSEQIGKLPGTSIADTLGRLPGLAVQTVSGRPQVLTIHGLGPDFSTALVNGREQVSTSNNRDVQYDQYPASWFNNVEVHLSPTANLIGQGLSGTVDMRTIRPLEQDHPVAAVNAHYVWDSLGQIAPGPGVSDRGYQANGIWVNQFADHTFGVTVGVDMESNPAQIEHQAPWGYPNDANGDLVVGGSKNYGISDQLKRNALLTTLQYKPSDFFTSTLDLTYDNFRETEQAKGIEFPLFWGSGVTLVPGNVSNGFVQSGTYDNVKAVVRNDFNRTRAKVYNFGWNNAFHFNEDWSGDIDASYSRANRQDTLLESYSGTGYSTANGATDSIGFSENGGLLRLSPSLDYGSGQIVLTDPQGWGAGATPSIVQAGFINAPKTADYLARLRASVERDFASGPIASVQFGIDRATRNKTYNIDQDFLTLPNGSNTFNTSPIGAQTAPIPGASVGSPLSWMGIGSQVIYDPIALLNNGTYTVFPTALSSIAVPPNWKVREIDVTPYIQFNIDTTLGNNVSLRGNFGMQVPHTNQNSQGQRVAASAGGTNGSQAALVPVAGGTKYTRYLPSLNLVFGFGDNDDLRFGAARVLARARMDQMSASLGVTGNITHLGETDPNLSYFSASGGNAKLLPTMADNYNVSYEHYFSGGNGYQCTSADSAQSDLCRGGANSGYVSLSGYFLKLSDYINPNAAYLYDFAPFVSAYLTPAQQAQLGTTEGIVSGPTNDGRGYVKGAQVVLNTPLSMMTSALDGFGVILSGNYTKSSITYAGNANPITVPGLSERVANGTLYYERSGFEARVSDNYRSDFLGEVSGISATRIEQTIKGGSTYDAQVSYTFGNGRFSGLTLLLQGSNLSNKTFITYQNNDPRQVLTWEAYGRRYELGVSYKFQ